MAGMKAIRAQTARRVRLLPLPQVSRASALRAFRARSKGFGSSSPRVNGRLVRSLLEACWFRLVLDLAEGAGRFARCADPKCNRLYLARYPDDRYCSVLCRKRATTDRVAIREVKRWLKEKRKAGELTGAQWKAAREQAQKLYAGGEKNLDRLKENIEAFLAGLLRQ